MAYNGQFTRYVAEVEKVDNYNVIFHLTEPNSRFHGLFTVRWSACFMMPKHIFEQQDDVVAYTFNPPLSLGPYVLKDYDPNGNWYLWETREDWDRTTPRPLWRTRPQVRHVHCAWAKRQKGHGADGERLGCHP